MDIGDKIKKLRTSKNMTQEELGEILQVTRACVSKWEKKKGVPSRENLIEMSKYFNCSLDELLQLEKPEPEKKKFFTFKTVYLGVVGLVACLALGAIGYGAVKTFLKPSEEQTGEDLGDPESIYVFEKPSKMIYLLGQTFKQDGMSVYGVYQNGTEKEIKDWSVIDGENPFSELSPNKTLTVSYKTESMTKPLTTTFDGIKVVATLKEAGIPCGVVAATGPTIQKVNTSFNSQGLTFFVEYLLDDEVFVDKSKAYNLGQSPTGNSYDTIKLEKANQTMTEDVTSINVQYSQGKISAIPVVVADTLSVSMSKEQYDAKTDKFTKDKVILTANLPSGATRPVDPSGFTWNDSLEGEVIFGDNFNYTGDHHICCDLGGVFGEVTTSYKVVNGIEFGSSDSSLNEDHYKAQFEDAGLIGGAVIKRTGDDFEHEFIDDGCKWGEFHSQAYLRYAGTKYDCDEGGFVHNFDEATNSSITYEFTAPGGGLADLTLCGSSNKGFKKTEKDDGNHYSMSELRVQDAVEVYLNGVNVTEKFGDAVLAGEEDSFNDPVNYEKTMVIDGTTFNTGGRYLFCNWTKVKASGLSLKRGTNKLEIKASNGTASGHWDYFDIDTTAYKNKPSTGTITFPETVYEVGESDTITLNPILTGTGNLEYIVSNPFFATVDSNGVVTGKHVGNVMVAGLYGGAFKSVEVKIKLVEGENEDYYFAECEDDSLVTISTTGNTSAIIQTGPNYETDYRETGTCTYGALHAASYLGYEGTKYGASGNGFVHNFDQGNNASMTFTFTAGVSGSADLIVRGATNDVDRTKYIARELKVSTAVSILVNGVDISSLLNDSMKFNGETSSSSSEYNRPDHNGLTTSGRFLFLVWTEVRIPGITLKRGENTIQIIAKNSNKSGHWDCLKVDTTPYKS